MSRAPKKRVDPALLLSEIISTDFDLSKFRQVDETDIIQPNNFLEWIVGRDFCNTSILPWQIEQGMKLFSDYCPICSNPTYIDDLYDQPIADIQDNITFLEHGICPDCKKHRLELFTFDGTPNMPSLKNEYIACTGQRAGKCLSASIQVLTPQGPKRIDEIQIGETVYGYNKDGSISEAKVLNVFNQGVQEVTSLTYYNHEMFACTDTHRWLLTREDQHRANRGGKTYAGRKFEGTIQDLKKGVVFSRALVKIPGGPINEPHAYALGALAGDGCSRQGTPHSVWISSANELIPNKVAQSLGAEPRKQNSKNYSWAIKKQNIHINHYDEWLKDRYAHEKIIDLEVVKTWDRESRLALLAGLLDTDGSVSYAKNKYGEKTSLYLRFTSQSKSLIDAFQYLVLGLFQFKMFERTDRRAKYKNGPCYSLQIKNNFHIKRMLEELDSHLVVDSKKWKPEYDDLPVRNTHPEYVNLKKGRTYTDQTYDIEVDNETSLFVLAEQGVITHNSKSIALYTSYQLNRWLALPDPIQFYDLPAMEIVMGTFSALSADQAEENLWIPFRGLYDQAPWFTKYNEFLKQEEKRLGIPLAELKDTYILYPHKRFMTSFTGSDDRKKRGRTRLWGVIDEIAFLNSDQTSGKKKVMDADKNYAALNNSLSTIRQKAMKKLQAGYHNTQFAIMHNASSPYNAMDKIMRLVKGAALNPMAQVVHKATWELNPDYTVESTRQQNSALSQMEFERDFGAVPPFSDSPYIGEARVMEKLCSEKQLPLIEAIPQIHTDAMGDRHLYLEAKVLRSDKMVPRLLSLDNGYKQNAFGVTLFHYDAILRKPVLDFAMSLYPQPEAGMNVHFPMMFEMFIMPLVKHLKITNVFYDRWQSIDQIQRLRDMKIDAKAHSLSYDKDFLPFRQQLISGNMILPPCEVKVSDVKEAPNPLEITSKNPITNLIWQALTVREAGRKILKPLEGDDDLFRAFVLGGSRFLDEEVKKKYSVVSGVQNALSHMSVGTYTSNRGNVEKAMSTNPGQANRAGQYMRVRTSSRGGRR